MLELEAGRSTYFPGEWHVWRREKAARLLDASKSIDRYNADIARLQRFVDRFRYKKSKAKQAQAKLTHRPAQAGKTVVSDQFALLTRRSRRLGSSSGRAAQPHGAEVEGLWLSAGDKQLLDGVSLAISAASTLRWSGPTARARPRWETLLGGRGAARAPPGSVTGSSRAYFSQRTRLAGRARLGARLRPVDDGAPASEAQNLLGRFLFSGWSRTRSRLRCSPAVNGAGWRSRWCASGANFLVLDEPTNHLDPRAAKRGGALENFPATVLLVSTTARCSRGRRTDVGD